MKKAMSAAKWTWAQAIIGKLPALTIAAVLARGSAESSSAFATQPSVRGFRRIAPWDRLSKALSSLDLHGSPRSPAWAQWAGTKLLVDKGGEYKHHG